MKKYTDIYFIGIGGIGMSAIARFCKFKGYKVSGYDRTESELTRALVAEGIDVHYQDDCSFIPESVEDTLVIYTPAVPADMGELVYVREKGYRVIKRSQMLGELTRGETCLAVAGTHGKTTTSTMVAHILTEGANGCSAFLGGISKNYDTNMLVSETPTVVVEADEFDRSFLQLFPEIAVITSMDADHLDIYGDAEHIRRAFKDFASQVSGTVIAKYGLDITAEDTKARVMTYSYDNPEADFHAVLTDGDGNRDSRFDIHWPGGVIRDCVVGIPGWVNIENAVAAAAIGLTYGLAPEKIREALASFSGVKRRFDIQLKTDRCIYIDDYAHHPEEITAALSSIRGFYPEYRHTVIFQPHLYTRTRDFAEGFAASLSNVDRLILLDIYPAREEPIPGVTSEIIFRNVTAPEKVLLKKGELMDYLRKDELGAKELYVTVGAGDIDRFIEPIKELLTEKL